jgi:hypothetical protein
MTDKKVGPPASTGGTETTINTKTNPSGADGCQFSSNGHRDARGYADAYPLYVSSVDTTNLVIPQSSSMTQTTARRMRRGDQ